MPPIRFEALVGDALSKIGTDIQRVVPSVATPFPSWNELCGEEGGREGVAQKWMVVIGGSDGSGKTYLTVNLAAQGVIEGHKVGVINFEMTKTGFTQRYLSILSGLPKYQLEHGKYFKMESWLKARKVADDIYEESGGLLITNDTGVFSLDDIQEAYEKLVGQGCDMIFVDYAQLVTVKGQDGIFQKSEAVANELRVLTHQHKVSSFVVSQFNREGKKLTEPPTRHYLQGGSAWENNANQIVLIDHTMRVLDRDARKLYTRLIMDKNRHGPMPVDFPVEWDLVNMRWREGEPDEGVILSGGVVGPSEKPQAHPHDKKFGKQEDIF